MTSVVCSTQAQPVDKHYNSDGTRIRYIDVGRGEPVLLIHGYGGSIESIWVDSGVVGTLSQEFRVVALDCRGHGRSDKPHDPKSYGLKMVDDIAKFLDHFHLQKAHIVGYSMGASIAAKFTTMYPDRVITTTLGGSSGTRGWTARNERFTDEVATSLEQGKGTRPLILGLAPTDEPKPTEAFIEKRSRETLAHNDALALAAVMRSYHELAVTDDQLTAVRTPLLAIVGSADPNLAGVTSLQTLLPSLGVVVVNGASHSTADDRGAVKQLEFVRALRDFVAAHRSTMSH